MSNGFEDRGYLLAILEGLIVTFLWSTSYILIKRGLQALPPLTFAAYRYITSSTILLAFTLIRKGKSNLKIGKGLLKLFFLGVTGYSVAQGLQYVGLSYLPAVTVTFLLNFSPVIVLFFGIVFLRESPTPLQLVGMILVFFGAYLFFTAPISGGEWIGILVTLLSGTGWATYMVASRRFLLRDRFKPLNLTASSMFFGAIILLLSALLIEGPIGISLYEGASILWLSLVNTAFAFVLWTHALGRIKAFELAILQNTMLIQIGLLAWFFLGEALTTFKIIAMILVFTGVLIVQIAKRRNDTG